MSDAQWFAVAWPMEANLMKPFITPEIDKTGKQILRMQCEGVNVPELVRAVRGKRIVAVAMPRTHSVQATWELTLILQNSVLLEFSSACTQIVGWHEVGSLNIRMVHKLFETRVYLIQTKIPTFHITALEKLIYEDPDIVSECGLVLHGPAKQEIIIAVGIPPGSVSLKAPFVPGHFDPQFSLSHCRREKIV